MARAYHRGCCEGGYPGKWKGESSNPYFVQWKLGHLFLPLSQERDGWNINEKRACMHHLFRGYCAEAGMLEMSRGADVYLHCCAVTNPNILQAS
jgi:hypothetical protein